jgi:hypothetical protein
MCKHPFATGDMAAHQYFESVSEDGQLKQELGQLMAKEIENKQKIFETNFEKMVCVADLTLCPKFFKEIHNHYDFRGEEKAEMSLKKLQLLVIAYVNASQKVTWLMEFKTSNA